RASRLYRCRTFGKQCQDTFAAKFHETLCVCPLMVEWIRVEAKIAGVDDASNRRVDDNNSRAGNRVSHAYKFDVEFTDLELFVRVLVHDDRLQLKALRQWQTEVFKYFLDAANRKAAAIDRRRELRHDVRQTTDMIKVA